MGCVDYGNLIWITLQRSKTAQEAITEMDSLMQRWGYASEGESFSIADPNEVRTLPHLLTPLTLLILRSLLTLLPLLSLRCG
jgi:hypothetical protein